MGPWNEQTQLRRLARVQALLDQPGLSPWAQQYWTRVRDTICRDEARYNSRVVALYTQIRKQATEEWLQ